MLQVKQFDFTEYIQAVESYINAVEIVDIVWHETFITVYFR